MSLIRLHSQASEHLSVALQLVQTLLILQFAFLKKFLVWLFTSTQAWKKNLPVWSWSKLRTKTRLYCTWILHSTFPKALGQAQSEMSSWIGAKGCNHSSLFPLSQQWERPLFLTTGAGVRRSQRWQAHGFGKLGPEFRGLGNAKGYSLLDPVPMSLKWNGHFKT